MPPRGGTIGREARLVDWKLTRRRASLGKAEGAACREGLRANRPNRRRGPVEITPAGRL